MWTLKRFGLPRDAIPGCELESGFGEPAPGHERHDEIIELRGEGFNPTTVDEADIRNDLARLERP